MALTDIIKDPATYDHFGLIAFSFITFLAVWMIHTNKKPDRRVVIILLVIGILGLLVDGSILIFTRRLFMGG